MRTKNLILISLSRVSYFTNGSADPGGDENETDPYSTPLDRGIERGGILYSFNLI